MARYQTELLFDNRQISLFTFVAISLGSSFFSSVRNHGFQSRTSDTCQTRATSSPKIHPRTRDRCRRSRLTVDKAREFDRANSCVLRRLRGFGSQMATIHRAHQTLPSSRRNRRRGGRLWRTLFVASLFLA